MLVTLVALADLLDHRVLQLVALALASAQVVVLEYVGQARLTWGFAEYNHILLAQLKVWACMCAGLVAWLWLAYVFAGIFACVFCGLVLFTLFWAGSSECLDPLWEKRTVVLIVIGSVSVGVGVWLAVLGWEDADLKFSLQSLQP